MYINKDDQQDMIRLMAEYVEITDNGQIISRHSDALMAEFFYYADKIIYGIINAYKFTRFAELDDLVQQAREAIVMSVHKRQFNVLKGTIFNFISVVAARNLINYTTKINRNYALRSDADIEIFYNNDSLTFYQDFDKNLLLDDLECILVRFFDGKPRLIDLTRLLIQYFKAHRSSRFVKKDFIRYARAYNYSPAMVNTYFELCGRAKTIQPAIGDFLRAIDYDMPNGDRVFDIKGL